MLMHAFHKLNYKEIKEFLEISGYQNLNFERTNV